MVLISDRLLGTMLRVTGAVKVRHAAGEFDAHFEDEYSEPRFSSGPSVDSRAPVLSARTIDVESLERDALLDVFRDERSPAKQYRFKTHKPDGTGMSLVLLR